MRLIVVDDHPLFREGVAQILHAAWPDAEVLHAGSAEDGLALVRDGASLILLDMSLPGLQGADALAAFRRQCPEIPVAVLTASDDSRDLGVAIRGGARGFIRKNEPAKALLQAITRVLNGDVVFPNALPAVKPSRQHTNITPRQQEILDLICHGHPNKEIGRRLNLAETTVKTHVTAIFAALGVFSRTQAVIAARRYGLVPNEEMEGSGKD